MKIYFKILLFLCIGFFFKKSNCQNNQYIKSKLTIKDGLPSNIIWNIEWSKNDNIWLATQAGIIEYNGKNIHKNSLNQQFIDIQFNLDGKLITFDKFGDIYQIDDSLKPNIKRVYTNKIIPKNCFTNYAGYLLNPTIFEHIRNNKYWDFGCFNNKIFIINEHVFMKKHNDFDFEIYEHLGNQIEQISSVKLKKNETIFSIGGKIFLIENNQIFEVNKYLNRIKLVGTFNYKFDNIQWFHRNGQSHIAFIGENKIFYLGIKNNQVKIEEIGIVETEDLVKNIAYNETLNICILGTEANGIYIYKKKKLEIKKPNTKTKTNSFYVQIPISQNQIYTTEFGLIGPKSGTHKTHFKTTIDKNWIIDWKGRIWFSGENQISYFREGDISSTTYFKNKTTTGFWSFCCDSNLKRIYAYSTIGLYFIDSTDNFNKIYSNNKNFDPNDQPTVIKKIDQNLYICTNNGLYIYNLINKKIEKNLFKGEIIREIYKINHSFIICSYGNSLRTANHNFTKFQNHNDELNYLKYPHAIYFEKNKGIWISTNNGILYGSKKLLNALINDLDIKKYIRYINYQNGLDEIELNGGGNSSILNLKNKLSLTSTNGIIQFDIEDWKNNDNYDYYIEFKDPNGFYIPIEGNRIKLKHTVESCSFEILSTNWNTTSNNRYQYYWMGKWNWIKNESDLKVVLNTQEHGVFPLEIIKYNADGSIEVRKTFKIDIELKWTEKWWGIGFIILVSGFIIFCIVKIRLNRIRKINTELNKKIEDQTRELMVINKELEISNDKKSQIIAILGHDLFVPLKFLSQMGNTMIKNYESMTNEDVLDALLSISNTSNRLSMLCKNILSWIQYEKDDLELSHQEFELNDVVDQMIQIMSLATKQKGNTIIKDLPNKKIVNTNLDALGIVILNLLNNANRFSQNSHIYIKCDENNQKELIIKIKDEGIGMKDEIQKSILSQEHRHLTLPDTDHQKSSGIGYYIIREILKSVNGKIEISSNDKKVGTEITIIWPTNHI